MRKKDDFMRKKYGLLLILLIVVIFAAVLLNGKGMKTAGETDSIAGTEQTDSSEESFPEDESGSEKVEEYVVELDEDETYEIN